jgi:hypothetical protein
VLQRAISYASTPPPAAAPPRTKTRDDAVWLALLYHFHQPNGICLLRS